MEKGNGHDPLTVRMVEILERIEGEVKGLRGEVTTLRDDMHTLREDVHEIRADVSTLKNEMRGLREEMRADLAQHDEAHGDLISRVARLEAAVFKKTGS